MQTKEIKLRLSPEDHQALTQAATALGMPLAVYIKSAALEKLRSSSLGMTRNSPEDRTTVAQTTFRAKTQQYMVEQGYITKTELQERLASTQPPTKAHTIPANLGRLPDASLLTYTKERDPDGTSWRPTNPGRTLWQKV